MNRALLYLLLMRLKNTLLGSLRKPTRGIGLVLLVLVFVFMAVTKRDSAGVDGDLLLRQTILVAVLSLYLLLAVLGGIGEPGLGFLPADLDHVMPGPFHRREILVYHLMRQYLQILLLSFMYLVFLGAAALPRPGLAYLATVLTLGVAAHLQAASTLVAGQVGDRVFGRMRRASRGALLGIVAVAAVLAFVGLAGTEDVPAMLRRALASPVFRVLFYPALAAGDVAAARHIGDVLPSFLGLLACVVGSFALVLAFPLNLVESTVVTAAERRKALDRDVRVSGRGGRARAFPGAGALVWMGGLTLRRRLRVVVGLVVMLVVILLASGARRQGGDGSPPSMLWVLAFFPVIANIPLGFRGQRDNLELLKTLPLTAWRLAAAQVTVPCLLILGTQILAILAFLGMGRIEIRWAFGALLALPVLDVGIVALVEAFHLGQDPRQAGFLWSALQVLAMLVTLVPAILAFVSIRLLGGNVELAFLGGVLVHALVASGLLAVLAWRFRRWEPGQ